MKKRKKGRQQHENKRKVEKIEKKYKKKICLNTPGIRETHTLTLSQEPMNEYGHHPYYMVMEDDFGNSHSVLLHNSNAMGE